MTLADDRRAIADGISASRTSTLEASRAATSEASRSSSRQSIAAGRAQTSEAARRAVGRSLEEQRRGKTLPDDLNSLKPAARKDKVLAAREKTGGRPSTRGVGVWNPPTRVGTTGGGIASPVTEPLFSAREFWPDGFTTSDGLFVLPATKKVVMKDANDAEVIFEYANPLP